MIPPSAIEKRRQAAAQAQEQAIRWLAEPGAASFDKTERWSAAPIGGRNIAWLAQEAEEGDMQQQFLDMERVREGMLFHQPQAATLADLLQRAWREKM